MTKKNDHSEKTSTTARRTGVAVGVGSAAIVAALLYANRRRKKGAKPKAD